MKEYVEKIMKGTDRWYIFFGCVAAGFIFLLILIFAGWFLMIKETSVKEDTESSVENVPNFGTEIQTEHFEESVPSFGTSVSLINLQEEATPLLDENAVRLEVELSEYISRNELAEKEGTIIHVVIPEENENQLFFFVRFSTSGEIIQLVFDREKDVCIALKSYYTEEEILNEIWNGVCPSDRDIQE